MIAVPNKDYVRRGRGSSQKRTTTRKKQPTRKSSPKAKTPRKPWRSGLLAIILVSAFGYGLYLLSHDPEPETEVAQVVRPAPVATPKPQSKPSKEVLPPPPEERWEYVDDLPKRQIEVQAKEMKVSSIPYVMQCGAYKRVEPAEERKAMIAFQGLNSKVVKRPNSSWYRVILGPYSTNRDAMRDLHQLQRAKIEPCMIMRETDY